MLKNLQSKPNQNPKQNLESQTNEIDIDLTDNAFDDWYQQDKTADPIPDAGPEVEIPVEDAETASTRSWFNSVFTDEDGPDAMDTEMSDEMYSFSSDATTEITDMVMSNINSRLHGGDIESHQADAANRQKLKRAWELYLRWKKSYVTPSWYLVLTLFITYGMDTVTGVYKWYQRYLVLGWSRAWAKVTDMWSGDEELEEQKNSKEHQSAMRNARENAISVKDIADEVIPSRSKSIKPDVEEFELTEVCIYSGEKFKKGDGIPKVSKSFPELIGKFSSLSNYTAYKHQNGMMNYRGKGNKNKSE